MHNTGEKHEDGCQRAVPCRRHRLGQVGEAAAQQAAAPAGSWGGILGVARATTRLQDGDGAGGWRLAAACGYLLAAVHTGSRGDKRPPLGYSWCASNAWRALRCQESCQNARAT